MLCLYSNFYLVLPQLIRKHFKSKFSLNYQYHVARIDFQYKYLIGDIYNSVKIQVKLHKNLRKTIYEIYACEAKFVF